MVQEVKNTKIICDKCGKVIRDTRMSEAYFINMPTGATPRKDAAKINGKDICLHCCADYLEELCKINVDSYITVTTDIAQEEAKRKTNTFSFNFISDVDTVTNTNTNRSVQC